MNTKALLFLDVDGPLNPWAAKASQRPDGYGTIYLSPDGRVFSKKQKTYIRVWLKKDHGTHLADLGDLGYKVTWATKWNHLANDVICNYYGVDPYDVAEVTEAPEVGCRGWGIHWRECKCLHSKTETLLKYAEGRPFVWIDDESTERDVEWLKAHADQEHLVLTVSPRTGLTDEHFALLKDWIESLPDE